MFPALNALLGWHDGATPPEGSVILATDTLEPAGEFLLHHFIAAGVRSCSRTPAAAAEAADSTSRRASPVLLVALAAPFAHYAAVARKLGVNLNLAEERGHFTFLDGLSALTTMSHAALTAAGTATVSHRERFGPVDIADEHELACAQRLYSLVESAAASLMQSVKDERKGVYLIIDDISALLSVGMQPGCVVDFVRGCVRMVGRYSGNLIILAHADKAVTLDLDHEYLVKSLMYTADYVLAVQPLVTGVSRDVHGQLYLLSGPVTRVQRVAPRLVHYRIVDHGNGVDFFAPGFASGII